MSDTQDGKNIYDELCKFAGLVTVDFMAHMKPEEREHLDRLAEAGVMFCISVSGDVFSAPQITLEMIGTDGERQMLARIAGKQSALN